MGTKKKISTVNNDIKNRINPNLQVFDLILSGLYGRYCYVQNKSERDSYKVEKIIKKILCLFFIINPISQVDQSLLEYKLKIYQINHQIIKVKRNITMF